MLTDGRGGRLGERLMRRSPESPLRGIAVVVGFRWRVGIMVGWIRGLKGHMGRIGRMGMLAGYWFEFGRANPGGIGRGRLRYGGRGFTSRR